MEEKQHVFTLYCVSELLAVVVVVGNPVMWIKFFYIYSVKRILVIMNALVMKWLTADRRRQFYYVSY